MASVLVVEDDYLLAQTLRDWLQTAGLAVVGPYATLDGARGIAAELAVDAALLDIWLAEGQRSFEVAAMLQARGVPVAFLTGDPTVALPAGMRDCPRLVKPCAREEVVATILRLLESRAPAREPPTALPRPAGSGGV
jgi:DNA-binding response OmpR family regulator